MEEFFENLGYWLEQAYVYIPAILAFISSIGFPSLVQIAKIFASAKIYLSKISVILKKTNETVECVNALADFCLDMIDKDAEFFDQMAECTFNKKEKELYQKRAAALRERKANAFKKIESLKEDVEASKKKIKVKVRIKSEEKSDEKDSV